MAQIFGLTDKSTESIKAAIQGATPDQLLALKKADQDFAVQMQALGYKNVEELERIAAGDRASAREREIKTGDSATPRWLAIMVTFAWAAINAYTFRQAFSGGEISDDVRDIIFRLLGTLDAMMLAAWYYYFGTSASSRAKDDAAMVATARK